MNSVWAVTENRGGEIELLKIAETKGVAERYVKRNFLRRDKSTVSEWVVSEEQADLKAWSYVNKDEFADYESPEDYFDDHLECTHVCITKWKVLKAK